MTMEFEPFQAQRCEAITEFPVHGPEPDRTMEKRTEEGNRCLQRAAWRCRDTGKVVCTQHKKTLERRQQVTLEMLPKQVKIENIGANTRISLKEEGKPSQVHWLMADGESMRLDYKGDITSTIHKLKGKEI